MRVKEMHPLCCISLESPGIGGSDSPDAAADAAAAALSRTRSLPASFAVGGSDGGRGSEETVAGVLYKWTNYGKGWRSRWFLLRNGVLSYAKIRWPENLNLLPPLDDVRLIGEVSANRLARMDRDAAANTSFRRKNHKPPSSSGVVHLKVAEEGRDSLRISLALTCGHIIPSAFSSPVLVGVDFSSLSHKNFASSFILLISNYLSISIFSQIKKRGF